MSKFLDKDFLLDSKAAKTLYHEHAQLLPIIDYHCHINTAEIYSDRRFTDLADVWLGGDHYKWRLMRSCGVAEEYITGGASGYDKFMAFAAVLPRAAANPVYHWAHLELQRFFGISTPLTPETAPKIWEQTCEILKTDTSLSARGILKRMKVETIVTTDDPADNLEWHKRLAQDYSVSTKILPCFRPDNAMNIDSSSFAEYITRLGNCARFVITNYEDMKNVLRKRLVHFDANGCRAADHAMGDVVFEPAGEREIEEIFLKALRGDKVTVQEAHKYKYALLSFLTNEYVHMGWVMQLHLGVMRDVNTLMYKKLGANTGFDSIGTSIDFPELAKIIDALNIAGRLPKTIIFPINPNDNAAVSTLAVCFGAEGIHGRIQQGSAWWFNDSLEGIRQQLITFAENGVLGNFIGMLTDSRSFMSYTRHEYFRRILCGYLGTLIESGQYPGDTGYLGRLVEDVCYNNVKEYFGF